MGVVRDRSIVVLRRYVAGVGLPLALVGGAVWAWGRAPEASAVAGSFGVEVVEATGSTVPGSGQTPGSGAPGGGGTQTPGQAPGSVPPPTASVPTTPPPATSPVASTGPGLTETGVHLSVTPSADGTLEVYEQVVLGGVITRLELRPPDLRPAGPDFTASRPAATAVQVSIGGQPVSIGSGTVSTRRSVDLAQPASRLELRYVLTGVTVRSVPSTTGRALAALAPLTTTGTTPVVVTTTGGAVLNLTCPQLTGDAQACADGVAGAMSLRDPLPAVRDVVVLQLDLPRP